MTSKSCIRALNDFVKIPGVIFRHFSTSRIDGYGFKDLALYVILPKCWMKVNLLAFMAVFSFLPESDVFAADDHGNTLASATSVSVPSTTGGVIQYVGDLDCFRFTTAITLNITASTAGTTDTYGDLMDSGGNVLASNDDAYGSTNFSITRQLTFGTYYVRVRHYSSAASSGNYQLLLSGSSVALPQAIRTFGNNCEIANGDISPSFADFTDFGQVAFWGDSLDRMFQIRNLGGAVLSLTGSPAVAITGTAASAFSVISQPPTSINPGGVVSFTVRFLPNATGGGIKSATLSISSNDPVRNLSTFAIQGRSAALNDDTGNTFASAFVLLALEPSSVTVPRKLNYSGDLDFFRFTLSALRRVRLRTYGFNGSNPDTYGVLYNQSYGQVASNDNGGGNGQFLIEKSLSSGTYYLQVRGSTANVTGDYKLFVEILP